MLSFKNTASVYFIFTVYSVTKSLASRLKWCHTRISGICMIVLFVLLLLEIRNDKGVIVLNWNDMDTKFS